MKWTHFILIAQLAAVACRQQGDDASMTALLKSLDRSNAFIANQSEQVYMSLQQKVDDPYYVGRRQAWFPMADTVWTISRHFNHYLDSLEKAPQPAGQKELYDRVIQYRQAVYKAFFRDSLVNSMYYNKEDVKLSLEQIEKDIFIDSTYASGTASGMLKKVRNDVLLAESHLLSFAWRHVNVSHDYLTVASTIVGANGKYLRRGQQLEIIAGIGVFSLKSDPKITIDGRPSPINAEGYAEYKRIVKNTPGKYAVPVTITFTSPLGTRQTITKNVEYEIAP